MNQPNIEQYDEISLRELIEILFRQKKIIIGITVISILISSVVSFFLIQPVYEAKTVLMASQITDKVRSTQRIDGIEGILNSIAQYPQLTIETYRQQIKNPIILEEVIEELKLKERNITRINLESMITLDTIKDTNLIEIRVRNTDKELATKIANTLSNKFTNFISNMIKKQAEKSSGVIFNQFQIEKGKLDEVLLEYKNFLSQPNSVKELEKEVDSKLSLLTEYKTDLTTEKVLEQQIRAKINQAEKELKTTPEKIELKKSLSEEAFMAQVVSENTKETSNNLFDVSISVEEKNDNYYFLKSTISDFKISLAESLAKQKNLTKEIENAQKELKSLQGTLVEKQHEERIITRKIEFAQSTYDSFNKKLEESRIAQSSAVENAGIIIVSLASIPVNPISPNKKLNIAISGALGIMLGVFIAFFKEYWKKSGEKKRSS